MVDGGGKKNAPGKVTVYMFCKERMGEFENFHLVRAKRRAQTKL